jgi:glycosyltransferase involved in cell wall biosynthesis
LHVTVAVPCFNEAPTIAKVVGDFSRELPDAEILVFDNASTDDTAARAEKAGARVVREKRPGKGYVMQSIFEKVRSDVVVIVDGDDTYFAEDVHELLKPILEDRADMVVGNRLKDASDRALNDLRRFGNHLIIRIMNAVFRTTFRDVLSGYRVLNRNFMEAVPLITGGFETETELTLQGLEKGMVIEEIPIRYRERPSGSYSKLSPFADGYRILITIAMLLRNHRPLFFFSSLATVLAFVALGYVSAWALGWLPATSTVFHAVVVAGLVILALSLVIVGVMMNAINTGFRELQALNRRSR